MSGPKNKKINISRGLGSLTAFIYVVATLVFIALNTFFYVDSLHNFVDFQFLQSIVEDVLPINLFLLVCLGGSLLIMLLTFKLNSNLKKNKGGFVIFLELVLSVALIGFAFVLFGNKVSELNMYVDYLFSFIVLIGALSSIYAIIASLSRFNEKRKMERQARRFERNYMKNQRYNR